MSSNRLFVTESTHVRHSPSDSLPGVTKAETVHSLNLSTALRYLRAPRSS